MSNLIVETKKGKVEGFSENGVRKFLGVPFAEPPVGNLRFKRAVPVRAWNGIKECKNMPPKPVQFVVPVDMGESEDCLYLNVWAPENAENCPVFVWIYGGGLSYGSNSDPSYDGENMAKEGIVYVAITYRLGVFGFYDFAQYDPDCDTNCGVSDMVESLRFVKENIKAFGGNPDNITICGESGGGMGVMDMLACPAAKGLFNRAIAESAPSSILGGKKAAKYMVDRLLKIMGKTPADVKNFKNLPTEELKTAGRAMVKSYADEKPYVWVPGPVFGDDLLPERPWEALAHGSAEGVDLIIGTNKDEGTCFVRPFDPSQIAMPNTWEQIYKTLELNGKQDIYEEFKTHYEKLHPDNEFMQMADIGTDRGFFYETMLIVDSQKNKANVWLYRFDFAPAAFRQNGYGSVHSSEISYALNTLDKGYFSRSLIGTPQSEVNEIRDQINGAWVAFCKYGNPNHAKCEWVKYDDSTKITHVFDLKPHNESDYKRESYELWKKVGLLYTDDKF